MDEFFTHKCVTSDAPAPQSPTNSSSSNGVSTWSQSARCEFVVVQENQQAHGASRAVLASIVNMTLQSRKTSGVLLFTLHSASLVSTIHPSDKLVHVDYSSDASLYYASLSQPASASDNSQLLARLHDDIRAQLETSCAAHNRLQRSNEFNGESLSSPAAGARAVVVVLDSLNVLLEQSPVQKVLRFLRELRQNPHVGSVIVRFNASTQPTATRQLLTSESTAVAVVETPASLSAYPILAKERRREVPKDMHGFVLLLRQKKNGRSSESVDYFQIDGDHMRFFTAAQAEKKKLESAEKAVSKASSESSQASEHRSSSSLSATPSSASSQTQNKHHHQAALPVRQEEVSFNLSISVEEQLAKSRVQLPYMHQGQPPAPSSSSSAQSGNANAVSNGNSNLFFIDDDDPDWDDDDLDDDLDI
ncbi:hypothetical protein Gpo141_00009048 [Globisporangium polare]